MSKTDFIGRRELLARAGRLTAAAVVSYAAVALSGRRGAAHATDLPKISESDPQAVQFGYRHDAADVDLTKYPHRAEPEAADQVCASCALYGGGPGSRWGPCDVLPGKAVSATGWCSVWAAKTTG